MNNKETVPAYDAMNQPIVIGQCYGHSSSSNGVVRTNFGIAINTRLRNSHEYVVDLELVVSGFGSASAWNQEYGADKGFVVKSPITKKKVTMLSYHLFPVDQSKINYEDPSNKSVQTQ